MNIVNNGTLHKEVQQCPLRVESDSLWCDYCLDILGRSSVGFVNTRVVPLVCIRWFESADVLDSRIGKGAVGGGIVTQSTGNQAGNCLIPAILRPIPLKVGQFAIGRHQCRHRHPTVATFMQ
jgi:hypothetical protein